MLISLELFCFVIIFYLILKACLAPPMPTTRPIVSHSRRSNAFSPLGATHQEHNPWIFKQGQVTSANKPQARPRPRPFIEASSPTGHQATSLYSTRIVVQEWALTKPTTSQQTYRQKDPNLQERFESRFLHSYSFSQHFGSGLRETQETLYCRQHHRADSRDQQFYRKVTQSQWSRAGDLYTSSWGVQVWHPNPEQVWFSGLSEQQQLQVKNRP